MARWFQVGRPGVAKRVSQEVRDRVVAACDAGELYRGAIARVFQVSDVFVRKLLQRRRERNGDYSADPQPGRPPKTTPAQRDALRELIAAEPSLTLWQLRERLGLEMSLPCLHRLLVRMAITLKKKSGGRRSRIVPT
ncbi:MAG: hypothetical protein ACRDD1_13375 [Planctomycetia bacterium]